MWSAVKKVRTLANGLEWLIDKWGVNWRISNPEYLKMKSVFLIDIGLKFCKKKLFLLSGLTI